jgi:glycosyltransferase involved in cell wall biosynthesis
VRILILAPHPFFQPRGTPIAVRQVLEFLSTRGSNGVLPGVDPQSPVVMYAGNLAVYQGIGLLLEGFRHALIRVPTAHLVIVGGLEKDIALYGRKALRLGIKGRVRFLGPRPVAALESLFRRADVLVSPRIRGLNTPMKIYLYLDSGTAVLATRLRTHTRVLDDQTAYLVPSRAGSPGQWLSRAAQRSCPPEAAGQSGQGVCAAGIHSRSRRAKAQLLLQHDGVEGERGRLTGLYITLRHLKLPAPVPVTAP